MGVNDGVSEEDFITAKQVGKMLFNRVRNKWDAVIATTGYEGKGKTTAMYWVGRYSMTREFDPKRHVIFEKKYEDIKKRLDELDTYEFCDFDEAVRQFSSKRFMTRNSVSLEQLFSMIREGNYNIYALNIPRRKQLNKFFRDGRSFLWIHVIRRGLAAIHKADEDNPYGDPWNMKLNEKLFKQSVGGKGTTINQPLSRLMKAFKSNVNFIGFMKFPPMPPEVEALMKAWKDEHKAKGLGEDDEQMGSGYSKAMSKIHGYRYFLNELGILQRDIALLEGIQRSTISHSNDEVSEEVKVKSADLCSKYMITKVKDEKMGEKEAETL